MIANDSFTGSAILFPVLSPSAITAFDPVEQLAPSHSHLPLAFPHLSHTFASERFLATLYPSDIRRLAIAIFLLTLEIAFSRILSFPVFLALAVLSYNILLTVS